MTEGPTADAATQIVLTLVYEPGREPPSSGLAAQRLRDWLDGAAEVHGDGWPLTVTHTHGTVQARPATPPELSDVLFGRSRLDDAQRARAQDATHALEVSIAVDPDEVPMSVLARGLTLVRPLLDGFVAACDAEASTIHPGHWPASVADAPVPPRPSSLFALHAVGDEDGPRWIHSHGLARFGVPEIEVLEAPSDHVYTLGHLAQVVGARLLLEHAPPDGQPVAWGNGVAAALVPWAEVADLATTGGTADDRDAAHGPENRVLVVEGADGWANVADAAHTWGEHPVFYRTNWESRRMETLAAARWDLLTRVFPLLAASGDFQFLVKLVFGPEDQREHLWFTAHALTATTVDGTLLNEPHQDLGLHEGDRGVHDAARLSDFQVHSPFGTFDPETLPQLAAWLAQRLDDGGD